MNRFVALLVTSSCILGGCNTTSLSVAPGATGTTQRDGSVEVVSEKKHRVVVWLLTPKFSSKIDELPAFVVTATNRGSEPLSFGPGYVTAFSGDRPVRLYNMFEFVRDARNEAAFDRFLVEAHGNVEIRKTLNGIPGLGGGKPAIMVRTNIVNQQSDVRAAEARHLAEISGMLTPGIVAPGGSVSGVVRLHPQDVRAGEPLRLVITAGDQPHEFTFAVGQ